MSRSTSNRLKIEGEGNFEQWFTFCIFILLFIFLLQLPKKQKQTKNKVIMKEIRKYINHRVKDFIYLEVNSIYP
jgi:hypothetical protein